jgi:hypothetical protein
MMDDGLLVADGFSEAFLGRGRRCGQPDIAVYDVAKMVQILVERDGMSEEDAREHLEFNTIGSWVGPTTPIYVELIP